ncbi:hypothetical protein H9X86_02075 [Pseudoflavonifractor capillosus]|uniref:hypothetical protein n=1 Tax=Pseudoflavonifractor capillosus TaxID=106588 RepID=UPI0019566294|nr:hypothetical protein [Pseudoflavonifractor capillosus]MBM6896161.1 hypothetical protein [Pseudoflavonifractor capillosus]
MNEIDREVGLILLKRLWQRNMISEDLYLSASCSRFFDRKHFTHYAEDKPLQNQKEDQRHDDY